VLDRKWYYVTIEKKQAWRVTVQAEDELDAMDAALESTFEDDEPDYTGPPEVTYVEEVNRFVE
jgi:hypothetical protein